RGRGGRGPVATRGAPMLRPGGYGGAGEPARATRRQRRSRRRPLCEPLEGRALLSLFQGALSYPTSGWTTGVAVGDFANNGILDIVTSESVGDGVRLLPGKGDGTFGPTQSYQVGDLPTASARPYRI